MGTLRRQSLELVRQRDLVSFTALFVTKTKLKILEKALVLVNVMKKFVGYRTAWYIAEAKYYVINELLFSAMINEKAKKQRFYPSRKFINANHLCSLLKILLFQPMRELKNCNLFTIWQTCPPCLAGEKPTNKLQMPVLESSMWLIEFLAALPKLKVSSCFLPQVLKSWQAKRELNEDKQDIIIGVGYNQGIRLD